jgi:hypothetical protein
MTAREHLPHQRRDAEAGRFDRRAAASDRSLIVALPEDAHELAKLIAEVEELDRAGARQ